MFAGCPPDGSALLAPRALLPPTASPISFYSKRFKLNRRLRTRWHGACFYEGLEAKALRRHLQSPGEHWNAHRPPGRTGGALTLGEYTACQTHARKEKTLMRAIRMTTLGLSVALLGLWANLALATPADNISSLVRQGTVISIDTHNQATLQLEDGTTFTMPEKYWQKGWKAGDRVQCSTEEYAGSQEEISTWNTTCEQD